MPAAAALARPLGALCGDAMMTLDREISALLQREILAELAVVLFCGGREREMNCGDSSLGERALCY